MSNRSYPADFSRPLREVPVATDEDVQRMLERLRRRCKVGKTSSQQAHEEARQRVELNFDAASSAGQPSPADGLHVSAIAEKTACAGGGSQASIFDGGALIQPTRSAPIISPSNTGSSGNHGSDPGLGDAGAERRSIRPGGPSEGPGSGCEVSDDTSLAPSAPVLVWERISQYAMRTTCGAYTCSKVVVNGIVTYELWMRQAGLERPICIGRGIPDFESAKRMIIV